MRLHQRSINRWKEQANKDRGLFLLMNQWANIKQEGKSLVTYFNINNYKKIAVYGVSYVGLRLIKELRHSEIELSYGIDKNAQNIYSELNLVTLEDELSDVDAIVVTTVTEFDEIQDALLKKLNCQVLAIEDILNEI